MPGPALKSLFDLSGRVAIITGGSRGLGYEMAEGLAEAGAKLMLCAPRGLAHAGGQRPSHARLHRRRRHL